jgi:hypothetical protein
MWRCVLALALILAAGCSRAVSLPGADDVQRPFPDVGGQAVMVLPVQSGMPSIALPATAQPGAVPSLLSHEMRQALEGEVAFWLSERAPRVRWTAPAAVERAIQGGGRVDVDVRSLSVRDFQRSRLQSIGDPLYGELRRVGVLLDVRLALLPLGAVWITEQTGVGRVHISAVLIDTIGGDVLWQGVVAGAPGAYADAAAMASAAQALAQLVPR